MSLNERWLVEEEGLRRGEVGTRRLQRFPLVVINNAIYFSFENDVQSVRNINYLLHLNKTCWADPGRCAHSLLVSS